MSAGRFFVAPIVPADPARVVLPADIASQARNVLRMQPGDTLTLLDGSGEAVRIVLTEVGRDAVVGQITSRAPVTTEPRVRLTLAVGLLKAAKFEWVVQKATELGISAILPVRFARSVVEDVSLPKLARWRAIATEAAEQADRGCVPTILAPLPFTAALAKVGTGETALLAYEDLAASTKPARTITQALAQPVPTAYLFIGPEGGITPNEATLAQSQGVQLVTLGPRILRAETAALVATTLALAALGELG